MHTAQYIRDGNNDRSALLVVIMTKASFDLVHSVIGIGLCEGRKQFNICEMLRNMGAIREAGGSDREDDSDLSNP
jgi:hypothetical protein